MMLTQERADILTSFFTKDLDQAQKIFDMDLEDALAVVNAEGYDFSAEELEAYNEALKQNLKQGELDDSDLDNVSGGVVVSTGVMIACGLGGFAAAFACNKKW